MIGRSCLGQRLSDDLLCGSDSANITEEPKIPFLSLNSMEQQHSNTKLFRLLERNFTGPVFFAISNIFEYANLEYCYMDQKGQGMFLTSSLAFQDFLSRFLSLGCNKFWLHLRVHFLPCC